MEKVYFYVSDDGQSIFGAETDKGHVPVFFTDDVTACEFGAANVPEHLRSTTVFAANDSEQDLYDYANMKETTYVLLDGKLMTRAAMFKQLADDSN